MTVHWLIRRYTITQHGHVGSILGPFDHSAIFGNGSSIGCVRIGFRDRGRRILIMISHGIASRFDQPGNSHGLLAARMQCLQAFEHLTILCRPLVPSEYFHYLPEQYYPQTKYLDTLIVKEDYDKDLTHLQSTKNPKLKQPVSFYYQQFQEQQYFTVKSLTCKSSANLTHFAPHCYIGFEMRVRCRSNFSLSIYYHPRPPC